MTVKELIEILNKIEDKNRVCMIASEDVGGSYEVDAVVETSMKKDIPALFIGLDWYRPKRDDKFYYCNKEEIKDNK